MFFFFINNSFRYFIILVHSGATLAHRAMQRGPCKSRVTVTSAHAVLFQYNDIALHNNYVASFCRVTLSIATRTLKTRTIASYKRSNLYQTMSNVINY